MVANIMAEPITVPHFALPFRFAASANGVHARITEQDSYEEIRDCVSAIVRYTRGERPEAPTFGITPQEFAMPVDIDHILSQAELHEPRLTMVISSEIPTSDVGIENVVLGIIEGDIRMGGTNV
jgi:hypothetical protein